MTLAITHAHVSAIADDGSDVGSNAWNAAHTLTGTVSLAQGGTNVTSFTANQLHYSDGTSILGAAGTTWDNTNQVLTIAGATVTASNPVLNLTQTWNNAAVAFTGLKLNVTNTTSIASSSSGPGSLLADFQVGGTSVLSLSREGILYSPGTSGANGLAITSSGTVFGQANNGWVGSNAGAFAGIGAFAGSIGLVEMRNDVAIAWSSSGTLGNSPDLSLFRDAAGILAQRNSTSAQTLRVYNTFTDASNYERGVFDWTTTANVLTIGAQAAGTGAARSIQLLTTGQINVGATGNSIFRMDVSNSVLTLNWSGVVGFYAGSSVAGFASCGTTYVAPSVIGICNGSANDISGWFNYGGQKRVTSDFTVTSSTALVNVTGLSVNLQAGRTYTFEAELYVTDAAAGGVQAAIAGTATATAIQYTGYTIADNAIKGKTNATALATAVGSTVTTETSGIVVRITGTITVNAAGTLTVQMAQNTSNGTATTAKRGSYFIVYDMA